MSPRSVLLRGSLAFLLCSTAVGEAVWAQTNQQKNFTPNCPDHDYYDRKIQYLNTQLDQAVNTLAFYEQMTDAVQADAKDAQRATETRLAKLTQDTTATHNADLAALKTAQNQLAAANARVEALQAQLTAKSQIQFRMMETPKTGRDPMRGLIPEDQVGRYIKPAYTLKFTPLPTDKQSFRAVAPQSFPDRKSCLDAKATHQAVLLSQNNKPLITSQELSETGPDDRYQCAPIK